MVLKDTDYYFPCIAAVDVRGGISTVDHLKDAFRSDKYSLSKMRIFGAYPLSCKVSNMSCQSLAISSALPDLMCIVYILCVSK